MNHVTEQQFQAYIADTLSTEDRTVIEDHMYHCDLCLEQYMTCIEHEAMNLPALPDDAEWTEHMMNIISDKSMEQPVAESSQSIITKRFIHYTIAASITLCLMVSGAFQGVVGWTSSFSDLSQRDSKSVSQHIVDRTFQWIDLQYEHLKEVEH